MIKLIQSGAPLSLGQRLKLTASLSWPAIMAQLSSILMQYIDAAMVGRLGASDSAAVGLVSTSLWLFWGTCSAATMGFSVQVAHRVGAADYSMARSILRQGITSSIVIGAVVALIGMAIAHPLPIWLGGDETINSKASLYFMVFVAALPVLTLNYLGCAVMRASGNMKVPGGLNVMMCVLDVVFNFLLIFPARQIDVGAVHLTVPGAGLGVLGAALGTVAAELVCAAWRSSFLAEGGVTVMSARAGNVIGGGDFAVDRIVPDCVRAALSGQEIIVRNPASIRPFQHVLEPLMVYLLMAKKQYENPAYAGSYNVGPDETDCYAAGDLVTLFCEKWNQASGEHVGWKNVSDGGPHEANYLKLDCSKLKTTFGWRPVWNLETAMEKIVEWTLAYRDKGDLYALMCRQIEAFTCE